MARITNQLALMVLTLAIVIGATVLAWLELVGGSEVLAIYGVVLGYVFGVATPSSTFTGGGGGGGGSA